MDKKLIVVAIAIGTIIVSTLLQIMVESGQLSDRAKRLTWISFAAGLVALALVALLALGR